MKTTATISLVPRRVLLLALLLLPLLLPAGCVSAAPEIRPADEEFAFVDLAFEG